MKPLPGFFIAYFSSWAGHNAILSCGEPHIGQVFTSVCVYGSLSVATSPSLVLQQER